MSKITAISNARFLKRGLRPGACQVFAIPAPLVDLLDMPGELAFYLSKAQKLELKPSETANADIAPVEKHRFLLLLDVEQ